ncbi:alpha-mannosidase, partial [Paenibacillus helianthi]|uniref:alpha-mannosidase n=1 Tax=Paenibacillus helianthi TaxID=1349432 RepID=UPI000A858F79
YGHGDGGGGVTREMLEYIRRADLMVGLPASTFSSAADFFAGMEERQPKLPEWRGDLYLELHRGTYTTHGRNKRNNRKAEILYREAELWQTLAAPAMKPELRSSSAEQLHHGWKRILLNQFHDIIPGSAIPEAYETSEKEYREVFALGEAALQPGLEALAAQVTTAGEGQPYVLFNSLGWARDAVVSIPWADTEASDTEWTLAAYDASGNALPIDLVIGLPAADVALDPTTDHRTAYIHVPAIPAMGYKTIWLRRGERPTPGSPEAVNMPDRMLAAKMSAAGASVKHPEAAAIHADASSARPERTVLNDRWETPHYRLTFNERGEITSLFDKAAERGVVQQGGRANQFHFFHDRPTLWDAWDIDSRYEAQPAGEAELVEKYVLHSGQVRDVLRFRWTLGQSLITQDLILYAHDRRIDFKTHVDWKEAHKLLKVGFPVDVVADKATYEIPFGALERPTHRNTSWEQAQYEVCGHRFVDVSEHGYGVSLLNDCKYGYDIQGSTIRLSLLRAPQWPDATADLGTHDFTYSLYPHPGDWRSAHTLRKAAELNHEVQVTTAEGCRGSIPSTGSFIRFSGQHVVLDTVKPSEDGQGCVLRFYESAGGRETVTLGWNQPFSEVYRSNALEEKLEPVAHHPGEFELHFAPFEIQTIYVK